jgi:UPF0716 family protein affecting phage T7 exclusion
LAIVVIGGLVSSTLLTLIVLPVLYRWMERRLNDARVVSTDPQARSETEPVNPVVTQGQAHAAGLRIPRQIGNYGRPE